MFSVLFEVHPRSSEWDAYLGYAKMLRPELEKIDGFVDNIRYKSLRREGWILSLSSWRDEKSLVRWRTHAGHHGIQEKGRSEVLLDYHLRVGQVTKDSKVPTGYMLREQRLDETEAGEGTTVTLITGTFQADTMKNIAPRDLAKWLGLDAGAGGLLDWDVYTAVLAPEDALLFISWKDRVSADSYELSAKVQDGSRLRQVRVVRDYGMFDRRETPQYYPTVERAGS